MYARVYVDINKVGEGHLSALLPLVVEFCCVVGADGNCLGHDGDREVHQSAVAVVEKVFQPHTIGIAERDGLETLTILLCPYHKAEITRLHLGLAEHPTVEEQILVAA